MSKASFHTQAKTMKFALRPLFFFFKFDGDMVKVGIKMSFSRPYYVVTTSLPGSHCAFILGSYYAPVTRAPGPSISYMYHVLAMSKKIASRAYLVLTASLQSLHILWQVLLFV